jgi:methyl-accepting chemotaxis protein
MVFRRSGAGLLIAAATLTVLAVTAIALVLTQRLLASAHDGDYELMREMLADFIKDAEEQALARAEMVASVPSVSAALASRDRPKLLAETQRMFEIQRDKYDLDQAQFHVPPGISFLRLHDPGKFGDDQTKDAPMLAEVLTSKVVRKGIAITRTGPAIFGIVPILNDGKLAGSFEVGLDLGPELDTIKEAYGLEAAAYFDEKLLRETATDAAAEIMTPKNRVGRFIRYHATHPDLMGGLVSDREIDVSEPRSYERSFAGASWGVQLVPIYNHANKQLGVIALATSFQADKTLAGRARACGNCSPASWPSCS